jgi:hypothetical protein
VDYWISCKNNQQGPFGLQQLQLMWQQGQLTPDTYFYDYGRSEWLLLHTLLGTRRGLFTVKEAFVRLGQNRQTGCLSVYNPAESLHLFVEGGYVVCAMGGKDQGEAALSHALELENAAYEWFHEARPPATNLRVNITALALKQAIVPELRPGNDAPRKQNTAALPKLVPRQAEVRQNFTYVLVPSGASSQGIRLVKSTNVVGREEYCDVIIPDNQVSRKHCLLEAGEQNIKVSDLESHNGTYVNGALVSKGFLNVGDTLCLGNYSLVLKKEQKKAPDLT